MTNNTCAKAKALAWTGAKVTVQGTTSGASNEYGTGINCGDYATVMAARQVYYTLPLTAGQSYRITFSPKYHYARLYLFQKCGVTGINTDCASQGKTGLVSASINSGYTGVFIFKPTKSGTWYLAVDGTSNKHHGAFTLMAERFPGMSHDMCAKASPVTFKAGAVTINGHTGGASNEHGAAINCGHKSYTYKGGQLYYKVALKAGQIYSFSVKTNFYATMYLFRSSNCTAAGINADCSSAGKTGQFDYYVAPNQTNTFSFKPTTSGDYTVAVDSRYATYAGSFTLSIKEYTPQTNGTCTKATQLTLAGGKVALNGSTKGLSNEYGAGILCGQSSANYAFDAPQQYFKVTLAAGKSYRLALTPAYYYGALILFGANCGDKAINADCASKGAKGGYVKTSTNKTSYLLYTPKATGLHHLAVDGTSGSSSGQGSYQLSLEEVPTPTNGTCAKAQSVTLKAGATTTLLGDTTSLSNEFGTQIFCGDYSTIYTGNQAYFKLSLKGGQKYTFSFKPTFSSARFYIFGASCKPSDINKACGSGGKSGAVSKTVYANSTTTLTWTPPATGTYQLAVDSTKPAEKGTFIMEIK